MKHIGLRGKLILRFFFLQRSYLYFWSPELSAAPTDLTSSRVSLSKSIIAADGRTRTGTGLLRPNGF
jgi:hypothetical protein